MLSVYPRNSFLKVSTSFSGVLSGTSAHDLSSWRLILCPLYIRRCLPIRLLLLAGGCSTPSHAAIDRKPSLPNARHEKFRVAWGRMKVALTHPKVDFPDIQGRGARIQTPFNPLTGTGLFNLMIKKFPFSPSVGKWTYPTWSYEVNGAIWSLLWLPFDLLRLSCF